MWYPITKNPWLWRVGLVALGLDLGIWLSPRIPAIGVTDALLFCLALGVTLMATGAGLGGAILMVPVLLLMRRMGVIVWLPNQIGTLAALSAAVAAGNGARVHHQQGTVVPRLAWPMGVVGSLSALVMAHRALHWNPQSIIYLDTALTVIAVIFLWATPKARSRQDTATSTARLILTVLATIIIGVSSGITGMPGSFLLIPALLRIARLPYRHAVGTSLQTIFFIASTTFLIKLHQGFFPLSFGVPILAGSLTGSALGSRWASASSQRTLRILATATILLGSAAALLL